MVAKKATRKRTAAKKSTAKKTTAKAPESPAASDEAKASAKKAGPEAESKRADTEKRLEEQGETPSLDRDDPARGWDAQQGALPSTAKDLYADDPPKYSKEQLPDSERLKKLGYKPIMREVQRPDAD
ncbi:MAG: hypothetical protein ABR616_18845 [Dermatophilaceae bacterium]|nr:hypothetical protein [Intrasporangiaceae bacterium]